MFQLSGPLPKVSHTSTRRSASGNGSGFSSVLLITLKMVVLAPMPSASVSIATSAKPGASRQVPQTVAHVLNKASHFHHLRYKTGSCEIRIGPENRRPS